MIKGETMDDLMNLLEKLKIKINEDKEEQKWVAALLYAHSVMPKDMADTLERFGVDMNPEVNTLALLALYMLVPRNLFVQIVDPDNIHKNMDEKIKKLLRGVQ